MNIPNEVLIESIKANEYYTKTMKDFDVTVNTLFKTFVDQHNTSSTNPAIFKLVSSRLSSLKRYIASAQEKYLTNLSECTTICNNINDNVNKHDIEQTLKQISRTSKDYLNDTPRPPQIQMMSNFSELLMMFSDELQDIGYGTFNEQMIIEINNFFKTHFNCRLEEPKKIAGANPSSYKVIHNNGEVVVQERYDIYTEQ